MIPVLRRLLNSKFKAYLVIFLTIILSALGMYLAFVYDSPAWIWAFIGATTCANLLAIFIK
jgi:hypothetical protein